jgi:ADP-heptose:LPS heptosyltransferase
LKILIIRFSSIGDIVLTTPVIRACAQQIENAEIHFLTKSSFSSLVQYNPHINQVWELESDLSILAGLLRKESFDYIIDLHNNLRTRYLSILMRRKFIRFDKINFRKWLLVNHWSKRMPKVHIVDRYLRTLSNLGVVKDNQGLEFYPAPNTSIHNAISEGKQFACFAIGGQHNTKKLPIDKIIALCNLIEYDVILIGGKEDIAVGSRVSKECDNVSSLCGDLTIDQSAAIIKESICIISHDTGMMHIASALKKMVISIWGNTVPEFGMSPYRPAPSSIKFEVENLGCRPCSKIGHQKCPNAHFKCMQDQNLEAISRTVNLAFAGE